MSDQQPEKDEKPRYFGDVNSSLQENTLIRGWAWDSHNPATPVNVEVYIDGNIAGITSANYHREDLLRISKNGNQGVLFPVPPSLCDEQLHEVQIKIVDTDKYFPDAPKKLIFPYPEHVKVEFQKYTYQIQLFENRVQELEYNKLLLEQEGCQLEQNIVDIRNLADLAKSRQEELEQENSQLQHSLDDARNELTTTLHTLQQMEQLFEGNQSVFDEIEMLLNDAN